MTRLLDYADLPARAMMALIFVLSGVSKIGGFTATQGYMEAHGLPGILLAPTIVFEIGAGLAMIVGVLTRPTALALAGFSLASAIIFHADFGDRVQLIMFLKNLAMAGGLLLLAKHGPGALSIDGYRARESR